MIFDRIKDFEKLRVVYMAPYTDSYDVRFNHQQFRIFGDNSWRKTNKKRVRIMRMKYLFDSYDED